MYHEMDGESEVEDGEDVVLAEEEGVDVPVPAGGPEL